jgi:hypothetical protein
VSVFVNESALKAWLTAGKPANAPTPAPQSSTSRSTASRPDEAKEKNG